MSEGGREGGREEERVGVYRRRKVVSKVRGVRVRVSRRGDI